MLPKRTFRLVLVLAWLSGAGACSEYNPSCPLGAPEVWGEFNRDLDISRELVSRCEAPIGNFLADALLGYPYGFRDSMSGADISVRVALIHAGSISDQVSCGGLSERRGMLPRGGVTDQDIHQLLPGGDRVVLLKIRGGLIKNVVERAVSGLEPGMEPGSERFLQVAAELGMRVEVDCSGTAQELGPDRKSIATPGSRVLRIHVGNSVIDPTDPDSLEGIFFLAVPASLVETDAQGVPALGFVGFQDPEVIVFETHLTLVEVARWWLEEYPRDMDYPVVEGRLQLLNCPEGSGCPAP